MSSLFRRAYVPPLPRPGTETVVERRLLIRPDMLPGNVGDNINMPSLLRVPDWIDRPLGRYYLYFSSHHASPQIRLAFADRIEGPWQVRPDGVLDAGKIPFIANFVAAPDVHVDHNRRRIRMYFHSIIARQRRMKAFVATSGDGLDFTALPPPLGSFYFRAFPSRDAWYALSKGGRLHRSPDGLTPFTRGPNAFPRIPGNGRNYNASGSVRHISVDVASDHADIYYTRIGDAPERILKSRLDFGRKWRKWRAGPPEEVMRAVEHWEGAGLPILPSRLGAATEPVHQLRDPEIFTDDDGARYLLYTVAGERGIAMARLAARTASSI